MRNRKKKRQKKKLLIPGLSSLFLLAQTKIAFAASSWVDRSSSGIYNGNGNKEGVVNALNAFQSGIQVITSIIGQLLAPFFLMLGDSIYIFLGMAGMTLDSIIYGRVFNSAFMTDGIAMYTFDLTKGNPYGMISMVIFSTLTTFVFLAGIVRMMWGFVSFLYSGGGPRQREEMKSLTERFVVMMMLLALAPSLLDLALYIRDLVLYGVGSAGSNLALEIMDAASITLSDVYGGENVAKNFFATDSDASIMNQFRTAGEEGLFNAIMYDATIVLTIYFAFTYIGAALSMTALVGFLPIAAVFELVERGMLGNWLKAIFGILLLPVIDAALLLVPVLIGVFGASASGELSTAYALVQFIACCCVIPARGYVRTMFGIAGSRGMEMAGIGAAVSGMMALSAVGKKAKSIYDQHKAGEESAAADNDSSAVYGEQAKTLDLTSEEQEAEGAAVANRADPEKEIITPLSEQQMEGMTHSERANARAKNLAAGISRMNEASAELKDDIDELQQEADMKGDAIQALNETIAANELKKAGLDPKAPENAVTLKDLNEKIKEDTLGRTKLLSEQKELQAEIGEKKAKREKLSQASREAGSVLAQMQKNNQSFGVTDQTPVLDNLATIDNFELPAYKNISPERKAELYQERAKRQQEENRRRVVGSSAGAAVGGVTGFTGGLFTGGAGIAVATSAGMILGSSAGDMAAQHSMKVKQGTEEAPPREPVKPVIENTWEPEPLKDPHRKRGSFSESFDSRSMGIEVTVPRGGYQVGTEEWKNYTYDEVWNKTVADDSNARVMSEISRQKLRDVSKDLRADINAHLDPEHLLYEKEDRGLSSLTETRDVIINELVSEAAQRYNESMCDELVRRGLIPSYIEDEIIRSGILPASANGQRGNETEDFVEDFKKHIVETRKEDGKNQILRYMQNLKLI